ncbi:MAG: leucyl aminopeptidase family protein [Bacteroidota bacterium]
MKLKISNSADGAEVLILPYRKGEVDWDQVAELSGLKVETEFEGSFQTSELLYGPTGNKLTILLGLGESQDKPKLSTAGRWLVHTYRKKLNSDVHIEANHLDLGELKELVHGIGLAAYDIGWMKSKKVDKSDLSDLTVVVNSDLVNIEAECKEALIEAEVSIRTIQLVDAPANVKTPQYLAQWAVESGQQFGYKTEVLDKEQLEKEGLEALLAVGQGSQHPPVLIKMEYKPEGLTEDAPKVGIVGKGITFDTGGLSIKSSTNLHYMKSDMGGAAAVLGAMELAARLKLNVHLIGLVPSAENSVDALSVKPGDVISSYSGKTIEIIDTDAEGRLILADGLAYMQKNYAPDTIIDLATLTGSSVMTLGYAAGAMFTPHDELADQLTIAGLAINERVWRLPLWDDYKGDIHSDIADVRNFSGKPVAGAITAAKFLEAFLIDTTNWAHLDIAGVAFGDSPFTKMKSATGFGVRLIVNYLKQIG